MSTNTTRRYLATDGVIPKALSLTREREYASIRWLEKRSNAANRFVLQLRRHIDDGSLSLAHILQSAATKG